jgi:hypothetical protein
MIQLTHHYIGVFCVNIMLKPSKDCKQAQGVSELMRGEGKGYEEK